uniref:p-glycoprotein 16.2 n=1 Tax=Parascaris univalens TaxID=6257 RepID=A0A7H9SKU1_PARUN|nr:P-glycoprotein 16.2 [Parascaris univalens]
MKRAQRVHPNGADICLNDLNQHANNDLKQAIQRSRPTGIKYFKEEFSQFVNIYRYARLIDFILIVCGILLALGQGILNSLSSVIFKQLTDSFVRAQTIIHGGSSLNSTKLNEFNSGAIGAINIYVGCGIGLLFVAFAASACWRIVCERQVHRIRIHYFSALIRQNSSWFNARDPDASINELANDIVAIKEGIGDKMGILIAYIVNSISCLIIAFYYSWKMTLVMIGFLPLLAGIVGLLAQFVTETSREATLEKNALNAMVKEVLTGIRTVIAYNGQEEECDRHARKLEEAAGFGIRKSLLVASGTGIIYCLIFIAMAVNFWLGTLICSNRQITPGAVFATFWAIMGGMIAIGHAAKQIMPIMTAKNSAVRIFAVIDHKSDVNNVSWQFGTLDEVKGDIEFTRLCYHYSVGKHKRPLEVSLKVPAGQSIAIVGQRDSGASALIELILRLQNPDSGEISLDGVSLERLNASWLRHMIGIIPSEPVIFDGTIEQNIHLGNSDLSDDAMRLFCRDANAHNFIVDLPEGYNTQIGEGGVNLSADQKLRIAIARVMAKNPPVLLIEESNTVLSEENDALIQDALQKARNGRTSITIARRPSAVKNIDQIFVFENGHIVEAGTDEELRELNGAYVDLMKEEEANECGGADDDEEETDQPEDVAHFKRQLSMSQSQVLLKSGTTKCRLARSLMNMNREEMELEELKEKANLQRFKPARFDEIIYFARKEWKVLIGALVATTISGIIFPLFSIIYGSVFNSISQPEEKNMPRGARLDAVFFTILGIFAGAFIFVGCFLFGWTGESMTARLRQQLFTRILYQDGAYFDSPEHTTPKLIKYLSSDVPKIRIAIDQKLAYVLQNISSLLVGVIIAFAYCAAVAPLGILIALIFIGAQAGIMFLLKKRLEVDAQVANKPARLIMEAIEHHEAVQYLTQEQRFCDLFEYHMKVIYRRALIRALIQSFAFSLQACFAYINFACLYRLGVALIASKRYQPFHVFQVVETLNCASMSLLTFNAYIPEYMRARFNAGLIFNMIRQRPQVDSSSDAGHRFDVFGNITMEHVYFAYPNNRADLVLRSVTLNFPQGRAIALTGPNGCGNCAPIELIERFYDPMDGVISFDGLNSHEINVRYLRQQMALVECEPTLFSRTIRENITYGLCNVPQQQVEQVAMIVRLHDFIRLLPEGYESRVDDDRIQIPPLEKHKIAIARAIIRNPRILLIDNSTSTLEPEEEQEVQDVLSHVRHGKTCIMATHYSWNTQLCDWIVVMKGGRVVEHGSHDQLMKKQGLYARLTRQQTFD